MDSRRRSQNKKPPRGSWQPTVPSWEKTFCKVIGALEWETLMDMKRFVHLYDNIINWNDSAGEEAFRSAKSRFWAKMNGFPYENNLPDPDLYIDKIDWESKINPELLYDLECKSLVPNENEKQESVIIFGDSLMPAQSFSPSGWGDAEGKVNKATNSTFDNPDNSWEQNWTKNDVTMKNGQEHYGNNSWFLDEGGGAMRDTGWRTGHSEEGHWTDFDNKNFKNEKQKSRSLVRNDAWGSWDLNQQQRGNTARYMSRYRTSRFPSEEYNHNSYSWRKRGSTKGVTRVWQ